MNTPDPVRPAGEAELREVLARHLWSDRYRSLADASWGEAVKIAASIPDGAAASALHAMWAQADRLIAGPLAQITADRDRLQDDLKAAVIQIGEHARARGEDEGKMRAAKWPGIVDGWRDRALAAEAELSAVDRAFEGLEETDRARRIGHWIGVAADECTQRTAAEAERDRLAAENAGLKRQLSAEQTHRLLAERAAERWQHRYEDLCNGPNG